MEEGVAGGNDFAGRNSGDNRSGDCWGLDGVGGLSARLNSRPFTKQNQKIIRKKVLGDALRVPRGHEAREPAYFFFFAAFFVAFFAAFFVAIVFYSPF